MPITERERFLYDLQGYLVLPGAVSPEFVRRCNAALDAHLDRAVPANRGAFTPALEGKPRSMLAGMLEWERPHCEPFREFMVPAGVVPHLNEFLGPGWRMDQPPFAFMSDPGSEGLQFHGPGRLGLNDGFYYDFTDGRSRSGMLTVSIALVDHPPGAGGFACIPGSHKSNLSCPQPILDWDEDRHLVLQPELEAGDVLIFNEATIHGTLPWTAEHQRRMVLFRYSPKFMTLGGGPAEHRLPSWADDLAPEQRAVLGAPGILAPPVLDDDGRLADTSASEYAR